jgi:hypothetical protein
MGWCSGSDIFDDLITCAQKYIPDNKKREEFYKEMIRSFEGHDWDCQDECIGTDDAFDAALKELHPTWFQGE